MSLALESKNYIFILSRSVFICTVGSTICLFLQIVEQKRVFFNLLFFALGNLFVSSMTYQWVRFASNFSGDSKSTVISMIQGIGTVLAAGVHLVVEKATNYSKEQNDYNDVDKMSIAHFAFSMIGLWGSFFICLCMRLDRRETEAEQPMVANAVSTQIATNDPNKPNVTVIKDKYDLENDRYKSLSLEKKVMELVTAKNNYIYLGLMTLLFAGMNYSYFLNMWFNRILTGTKSLGAINVRTDLIVYHGSKAKILISGTRLYPEIVFSLAQILFGFLSDNFPKKFQILAAYICCAISCALFFFLEKDEDKFFPHALGFAFSAFGYGAMTAILIRLMVEKYNAKNIMDSITILSICHYVSLILLGYLSLAIVAYFGPMRFVVNCIIGIALIVGICIILFVKEQFILSPHYFDANFVEATAAKAGYNQPQLDEAGTLFNANAGERFTALEAKLNEEKKGQDEKQEALISIDSEKKEESS